jgi:hypothetical protein
MKNTESETTILARKLAKLVKYFLADPSTYMDHYGYRHSSELFDDAHDEYDTPDGLNVSCHMQDHAFVICAGDYWNTCSQERWMTEKTDIICFSPTGGKDEYITSISGFTDETKFTIKDPSIYTEDVLFQQSLVLPNHAYDTLELYLELMKVCTTPFKVNLEYINIDEGLALYETN